MNQLPLETVSQVRNRDDGVMAPLFARGVSLLNSSARAPARRPPLVLLHPLGSTGEMSFSPLAESWRAAGHRVTTPDLPGHGTSRGTRFTWENARATINAAAAQGTPEKPVLIGHSLGAAAAIYAAQRQPSDFAGLILSGAGACWNDRYVKFGLPVAAAIGALTAAIGRRELLAHAAGVRGRQLVPSARNADINPIELWRAAVQLTRFDIRTTPVPAAPCAVIVLTDDRRMPPGLQRALARYLGCDHVDVTADHDAPLRQTARLREGIESALGILAGDGESPPSPQIPMALVEDVRRRESL
jgi:pimeloyl-ACP methyl ester carboxylesterase